MARVDDGELEMLLDGALHLLDPERAEEVRRYVETDEGRERLAAARRLRDRADAILGEVGPEVGAGAGAGAGVAGAGMPDFAEIRARAAAGGAGVGGGGAAGAGGASGAGPGAGAPGVERVPAPRRRPSLLWAASIAAALAVGWMGRGILPGGGSPVELGRQASAPEPAPAASAAPASEAPGAPAPGSSQASPSPGPSVSAEADAVAVPPAPTATAGRAPSAAPAEEAVPAAPPPEAVAPSYAQVLESRVAGERTLADGPAFKVALEPLSSPMGWPSGWETTTPPVAELPVLDVAARGDTTVILQALPEGGVLELRYRVASLALDAVVVTGAADPGRAERADAAPPTVSAPRTGAQTVDTRARGAVPPAAAPAPAPLAESGDARRSPVQAREALLTGGGLPPATLRIPFMGGGVELRAPVPDSVLARWGEEVVLRRMRGGER
jgi:hypothetical protein